MRLQVGVKVLIEKDGQYLFLKRSQSFASGPQKWDTPGGRIEPDERLEVALAREVREETNLLLELSLTLLSAQDIFAKDKDIHVVRLTYRGAASGSIKISSEHDEYRWMTIASILSEDHVDTYLRRVLEAGW